VVAGQSQTIPASPPSAPIAGTLGNPGGEPHAEADSGHEGAEPCGDREGNACHDVLPP
jgi:hypothetical protein